MTKLRVRAKTASRATTPHSACVQRTVSQATASHRACTRATLVLLRGLGDSRRRIGHRNAADLYVLVCVTVEVLRAKKGMGNLAAFGGSAEVYWQRLDRAVVMRTLGISIDEYKSAVTVLREAGLIEWQHDGGRAKAWVRLSPEGLAWAREVGLLPAEGNPA